MCSGFRVRNPLRGPQWGLPPRCARAPQGSAPRGYEAMRRSIDVSLFVLGPRCSALGHSVTPALGSRLSALGSRSPVSGLRSPSLKTPALPPDRCSDPAGPLLRLKLQTSTTPSLSPERVVPPASAFLSVKLFFRCNGCLRAAVSRRSPASLLPPCSACASRMQQPPSRAVQREREVAFGRIRSLAVASGRLRPSTLAPPTSRRRANPSRQSKLGARFTGDAGISGRSTLVQSS
jgi:hypothetical protein